MQNIDGAIKHLKDHQEYPASKQDLMEACNGLSDFSDVDKKWFSKHLSDRTYKSAEEVMEKLGWDKKDSFSYAAA